MYINGNTKIMVQFGLKLFYYIDTDEIPGFFLLLKNHIFIGTVKIPFLSFTCEDIGVAWLLT